MADARFEDRVIRAVRSLRPGEVASYGEVAAEAGSPGGARAVGRVLRHSPPGVPWWRVVRADGRIVCPSGGDQAARLRAEGVTVADGRVKFAGEARPGARGRAARADRSSMPSVPRPHGTD